MKIFDPTLGTLEHALDVRSQRHQVLAGNLANANTPGFVPREVDFAAAMAQAGQAVEAAAAPAAPLAGLTPPGEIPLAAADRPALAGPAALRSGPGSGAGIDGNAVDVDRALVAVAENALQYGAAARAAGKKLAILRYVASDGAA